MKDEGERMKDEEDGRFAHGAVMECSIAKTTREAPVIFILHPSAFILLQKVSHLELFRFEVFGVVRIGRRFDRDHFDDF
jgi:hypothetical protein